MNVKRTIKKIITGKNAVDGAGVKLVRVFGNADTKDFDPFLLFDAFDSEDPADYVKGFPWHPHRGIETITYIIEGNVEHGDSIGNSGTILSGECQWMTAGSGIIHQEMPKPSKRMLGCQLWLNLKAKDKMVSPKYRQILQSDIPIIEENSGSVLVLSGEYKQQKGALECDYIQTNYIDKELKPDREWTYSTRLEDTVFIYVVDGSVYLPDDSKSVPKRSLILFDKGDGINISAKEDGARFLIISAEPINEPIAWGGPIVMNTKEEIELAFKQLEDNTFISTRS